MPNPINRKILLAVIVVIYGVAIDFAVFSYFGKLPSVFALYGAIIAVLGAILAMKLRSVNAQYQRVNREDSSTS